MLTKIATEAGGDMRQSLVMLDMMVRGQASEYLMGQPKFMDGHTAPTRRRLSLFDGARSISCKGKTLDDRDTAHLGSDLMPLFVRQNYLNEEGASLEAAVRASEAIALGDLVNGTLWGTRD
jgi:hypothetical protein